MPRTLLAPSSLPPSSSFLLPGASSRAGGGAERHASRHAPFLRRCRKDGGRRFWPHRKGRGRRRVGHVAADRASRTPELRRCLKRAKPDHLSRGISKPSRVSRMPQATLALTTSHAASRGPEAQASRASTPSRGASWSPKLRGYRRRNEPDHLSIDIPEPRVARMSRAKLATAPEVRPSPNRDLGGISNETCHPKHPKKSQCARPLAATSI